MKHVRGLCIVFALLAAFVLSILYFRAPPDPVFEGRPASDWTRDLLAADYSTRGNAQSALKRLGSGALPQLRLLLRVRNGPWDRFLTSMSSRLKFLEYQPRDASLCRQRAAEMIALLGPQAAPAVPDLVSALAYDESETERALAIIGPASIPELTRALAHRKPLVRERAARLLGVIPPFSPATAAALVSAARDSSAPVRVQVAASLGRDPLFGRPTLAALLELTRDPEVAVRAVAVKSLGHAPPGSDAAIERVREALADESILVQIEAAKALWTLRRDTTTVVPALIKILGTTEGWQAAYALGEIGRDAAAAVPELVRVLRRETVPRPFRTPPSSAFALGKIGPAAIPALAPVLSDPDPSVRMSALMAFGFMADAGRPAVPKVLPLLQDPDQEVRHTAALILAMLGAKKEQMIAGLKDCLSAEDIFMSSAAAAYLREIAPEEDWVVEAR